MAPFLRGEIYILSSDAAGKRRPAVVISRDEINGGNQLVMVPFYSAQLDKRRQFSFCVLFTAQETGLDKDCVAKVDQISSIDKTKLDFGRGPIGKLNGKQLQKILQALNYVVGADVPSG